MLCFEVTLNDAKICTAGVPPDGGIHAMMSASHYNSAEAEPTRADLNVNGLFSDQHVTWVDGWGKLKVGDTVVIRVLNSNQPDPPRRLELRVGNEEESRLGPVQGGTTCTFCMKRQTEVQKLLSIADRGICDECVADFVQVLREEGIDPCNRSGNEVGSA